MESLSQILAYFIPSQIRQSGDWEQIRRAKMLVAFAPFFAAVSLGELTINFWAGDSLSLPQLAGSICMGLLPLFFRLSGNLKLSSLLFLTFPFVYLPLDLFQSGGLIHHQLVWFSVMPIMAAFLFGSRGGFLAGIMSIAEISFLFWSHIQGWLPAFDPKLLQMFAYGSISTILFVNLAYWVYERGQKKIVNQLKQSQLKAQQAAKSKDTFWANISHEYRTPMNGIMGMTNLLLETNINSEQKELLESIKDSGDILYRLISDVMDLSKLEMEELRLDPHPLNIRECIESVMAQFRHQVELKELVLTSDISQDVPKGILSDETRIQQILYHLVSNSIKFTEKGSISLYVESGSTEDSVVFSVKDTGIGIPDDKKDLLFQTIGQLDPSASRKYGGAGLGLIICKKICFLLGGEIHCDSSDGLGSTFSFSLKAIPIKTNENFQTIPNENAPLEASQLNILLVEDNITNRKLALSILENYGYSADVAENGQVALDKITSKKYDVVLMDVQMPIMDGITATKKIREDYPDNGPYIIALTANATPEDKDLSFEAGMDDFLGKPIHIPTLIRILRNQRGSTENLEELEENNNVLLFAKGLKEEYRLMNIEAMMDNFAGDLEVVEVLIDQFKYNSQTLMKRIRTAIEEQDAGELENASHAFKGAVANFFCNDIRNRAIVLENMGKIHQMEEAGEVFAEIEDLTGELLKELESFEAEDKAA
ncbi:MAG: response regulator [Halobacteriovoraceae bacterium]|jgi:signal transduction histidine kinase/FixJ family two-component response regulator|nr:response regulator [Halobacteriovoraceae bacterium]MBT5093242.1 response regulator [Halobacteriovoraceae bacterium]